MEISIIIGALVLYYIIIMSRGKKKRNRFQNPALPNPEHRKDVEGYINEFPHLCSGKSYEAIIFEYCTLFKTANRKKIRRAFSAELNTIFKPVNTKSDELL